MELPPYRAPTLSGVLWHVWEKSWQYIQKAGTVILAASILIWAITSFPTYTPSAADLSSLRSEFAAAHPEADQAAQDTWLATAGVQRSLEYSIAGRIGKAMEPLVRPLGFDWKIAVATVTGFAAKEVVVSTLGILYRVGTEENEASEGLRSALQKDTVWNPLVALVMMLFILVIPPCFATLATVKAELGWQWLGFLVAFLLVLGWLLGFAVFQLGSLAGLA